MFAEFRKRSELILPLERLDAEETLLAALDYENSVLIRDMNAKLQIIWTLPRPDQDRVVAIMRSPKLQKWITATTSSALLVNGNHRRSTMQQPTSFICAKLIHSIMPSLSNVEPQSDTTIALAFFCGEHLRAVDPDSRVDVMMRSLLAQLLLAYPHFDLRIVRRVRSIHYDDVNDLCDLFEMLVAQLPPRIIVFCMLDAISFYENTKRVCEEAEIVIEALVDIVERTKDGGCAFKLLLMSPWNSRVLYKKMHDQEGDVLWVPAKVPSQGGFTEAKWI